MARGLLPVPNSLLTFSSALSQGGPQHLTPVSRRGQGAGDTCGGLKWAAPSPHAPALPWVTAPPSRPIGDLLPLLHRPAKKLPHRCWHCNSFSVTVGFSAIVSPHKGAAEEGARGRGCAEGPLLEPLGPGYRLPLHSPAPEARPGEERWQEGRIFCLLWALSVLFLFSRTAFVAQGNDPWPLFISLLLSGGLCRR